jgi:hypothetical protein
VNTLLELVELFKAPFPRRKLDVRPWNQTYPAMPFRAAALELFRRAF